MSSKSSSDTNDKTGDILQKVLIEREIKPREFLRFTPAGQKAMLLKTAARVRGKRVVHVNATATEGGGGVAEILQSLIPYLRSLGVACDWYAINPKVGKKFFKVTNKLHDGLQGAQVKISAAEWKEYARVSQNIAENLEKIDCDVLVINDPQPLWAGMLAYGNKHKMYISHIDTSPARLPLWKKLLPALSSYHRIIFSNRDFVHGDLPKKKVKVFTPAIDPLAPKQQLVGHHKAREYLRKHGGIPPRGPLIVQVSRFDIWKNPLGVIEAFRFLEHQYPEAQLVFIGFNTAKDNPNARVVYEDVAAVAKDSPNIHLFFNPAGKDITEFTTMAQNGADIVVQNSIKEGFGLVVSEAMWKRKPVIGGPASGVRVQIKDGKNGFIVDSPEKMAEKIIYLLKNPSKKNSMGEAARRTVMEKFLFPRFVLDHLKAYISCLK